MYRLACPTPFGEIWLQGETPEIPADQPVVVAIGGVFCRKDALWFRMQSKIPEATVLAAQLPGHHCPAFEDPSVATMAEAFGYAIERHLGARPVLLCGESLGGTVALAVANPTVWRLAFDPPLRTGGLWPLRDFFAETYAAEPRTRRFLEASFGFDGQAFRELDYTPLVTRRGRVLAGALPLEPPREVDGFPPSLVGAAERQLLSKSPVIQLTHVAGAGHVLSWYEDMVIGTIREELGKAVLRWNQTVPRRARPVGADPAGDLPAKGADAG